MSFGCSCNTSTTNKATYKISFGNSIIELIWLSFSSHAISICPYRPVYSSACLVLTSTFPAMLPTFFFGTCCNHGCCAFFTCLCLAVAVLFSLIALGILGDTFQDGCMHRRHCFGNFTISECSDNVHLECYSERAHSYTDCGLKHWDHFNEKFVPNDDPPIYFQ